MDLFLKEIEFKIERGIPYTDAINIPSTKYKFIDHEKSEEIYDNFNNEWKSACKTMYERKIKGCSDKEVVKNNDYMLKDCNPINGKTFEELSKCFNDNNGNLNMDKLLDYRKVYERIL